jgi:hypothetical protein
MGQVVSWTHLSTFLFRGGEREKIIWQKRLEVGACGLAARVQMSHKARLCLSGPADGKGECKTTGDCTRTTLLPGSR